MTKMTLSQLAGVLFSLCLAIVPAEATQAHTYVSETNRHRRVHLTCYRLPGLRLCNPVDRALRRNNRAQPANSGSIIITKSISIVATAAVRRWYWLRAMRS